MIQTVVIPQKANFDMSVSLPDEYIGKQVNILFYTDEEVKQTSVSIMSKKKPSDFFGTLTKEEGEKMYDYLTKSRNEWERNF
jgi:hypothetical protein